MRDGKTGSELESTSLRAAGPGVILRSQDIRILVVDDDANHAHALAEILASVGYDVSVATSGENGLKTLRVGKFDIVISDLVMAPVSGLDVLRKAREANPAVEVVLISGHGTVDQAVNAIKLGAADYFTKPLDVAKVRAQVAELVRKVRARRAGEPERGPLDSAADRLSVTDAFSEFVGHSPHLQQVIATIRKVAATPATVLITGANGTGKELVARAIHRASPRRLRPFVALNCAAIAENILESELFGHVKGAFTGATSHREGRFEYADKGTLFLDEIGDMSLGLQVKLLRVIQEREITRVGANESRHVDVRIIAATNKNLEDEVKRGTFREDLYYRLKVVHIHMPDLRERRSDIPVLVDHFTREANLAFGRRITGMDPAAMSHLLNYDWPGNIRQLKNTIETMVVLANGDVLTIDDVPADIRGAAERTYALAPIAVFEGLSLAGIEEYMIRHHLQKFSGNRSKVAAALGISERTLYRKLKEYGIND